MRPFAMTPAEFVAKWRASELKERSASQEHFIDLCRMLDEPTPADADPTGERYCFERGARKDEGGDGWADVWKRHHFAWEYKGKHANLDMAFRQLRQYALALENPPLLIVSDMARFRIRTNWTNSVSRIHEFALEDLVEPSTRNLLKWATSTRSAFVRPMPARFRLPPISSATGWPRLVNGWPGGNPSVLGWSPPTRSGAETTGLSLTEWSRTARFSVRGPTDLG